MEAFHCYPNNDLEEHEIGEPDLFPNKETGKYCQCKCLPKELWENGCLIIVHNAFDGRQQLEQAKELLNI